MSESNSRHEFHGDLMTQPFRRLMKTGEILIGTVVTLSAPQVPEILAQSGFDWLFVDGEHSPLSSSDIEGIVRSAGLCPCLVRIRDQSEASIKSALDSGAAGIIAPFVNTAEEAKRIVTLCRYPPEGCRSMGVSRANGYGMQFQDYLRRANSDTSVIVLVEHVDAVKNIESIVRVAGIDAVFVGPYDLSASLGKPGEVNDPGVQSCIERVRRAVSDAGVHMGIFGMTPDALEGLRTQGFTLLAVGVDTVFLGSAAKTAVDRLKNSSCIS